jgi:hypothetical protein
MLFYYQTLVMEKMMMKVRMKKAKRITMALEA